MHAEIISVGTELLLGDTVDTNAAALGQRLAEWGIHHRHRQTVGDHQGRLVEALRLAQSRAEIVITIGGLGPTEDDLTRYAIAEALERPMVRDEAVVRRLQAFFRSRGVAWVELNGRQADLPEGGEWVANANGTALGFWVPTEDGGGVLALPGPPNEFLPMLDGPVRELLRGRGGVPLYRRTLRFVGIGESLLAAQFPELMEGERPTVAPYAKPGEVHLRIADADDETGRERVRQVEQLIRAKAGEHCYGADEETLPEVILSLLRREGQTLAVAESCTGGGIGARLTEVPGASDAFVGGVISYTEAVKHAHLGVPQAVLDGPGAVSNECAVAMAQGVRERLGATWGLSVTGYAGPDAPEGRLGEVWIGLAGPDRAEAVRFAFRGDRRTVRLRAVSQALTSLWQALREPARMGHS
jgi:nicotinamide-nucleotide amidase